MLGCVEGMAGGDKRVAKGWSEMGGRKEVRKEEGSAII